MMTLVGSETVNAGENQTERTAPNAGNEEEGSQREAARTPAAGPGTAGRGR